MTVIQEFCTRSSGKKQQALGRKSESGVAGYPRASCHSSKRVLLEFVLGEMCISYLTAFDGSDDGNAVKGCVHRLLLPLLHQEGMAE